MLEEIKKEFGKVQNKTEFIREAAERFPVKPQSIKQNWLCDSGFWSVPKKYRRELLEALREYNTRSL